MPLLTYYNKEEEDKCRCTICAPVLTDGLLTFILVSVDKRSLHSDC